MGGTTDNEEAILYLMSQSMMIYLNPADDRIHIQINEFLEAIIYTLSGKEVLISKGKYIDLSAMSEGIYIMQLENKSGPRGS